MNENIITYASIFQEALDKQLLEGATSGWMEDNAGQVIYSGGKEVKIPKLDMNGLGDYDRSKGYSDGTVTFEYQTKTMTKDRGRKFRLDAMDVNETNFTMSASNVMSKFQRTKVIPEIDAYRYSSIYAAALAKKFTKTYTLNPETILKALKDDIVAVQDKCGTDTELIITMSIPAANVLDDVTNINRSIDVAAFKQGEITLNVKRLNGSPIIRVPSERMKSAYTFVDGKTSGQEAGGFTPAAGAVDVHWIISARWAPIAVSKTDKVKIITPDKNQFADAWDISYRKYHDLWLTDNNIETVRTCAASGASG